MAPVRSRAGACTRSRPTTELAERDEADVTCAAAQEPQQPAALRREGRAGPLREWEMADDELAVLDAPDGTGEAVDEHRPEADASGAGEGGAVVRRDHARPVGMRQEHVVLLGQEAGRGGRPRIRTGRVGEVEELAALLVAERP